MFGDREASDEYEDDTPSKMTSQESDHYGGAPKRPGLVLPPPRRPDLVLPPPRGPGLVLPTFPVGGFKLNSTGKNLFDDSSPKSGDSSPQEIRASYPLSHKEETRNVVVENLLEKQLSKADIKVSSMPTTALDRVDKQGRKPVLEDDECLSGSANSLDEIEEVTRRVC